MFIYDGGGKIGLEYEQIVNMPKNEQKMLDFRIFRQIPAKMSLQSQCLCGF